MTICVRSKITAALDGNVARDMQAEPRGNRDVSLQDHHRPASSCPDSAQSEDRSQNRLQRPQQNDQAGYADLRPYQIRLEGEGRCNPNRLHAPTPWRERECRPLEPGANL